MNKQKKYKDGNLISRGIEWTDWTWNAVAGCKHGCRWKMPDGAIAICYAEEVAKGVAQRAYPEGFEYHYWHEGRLNEPLKIKEPAKIFLDSMSDLMGHWVPAEQIEAVLEIARQANWHSFQLLTKNAPRLLKFDFPPNVWAGVSSPPDFMFGRQLSRQSQAKMLHKTLQVLSQMEGITWMSVEPLSWDVAPIIKQYPNALKWAVIGAASNGSRYYQPEVAHIQNLLDVLDEQKVPVFFKGNLEWNPWREVFPNHHKIT
jgi:protein gp37